MNVYTFQVNDQNGQPVSLQNYRDQVLLIVNTATRCGFTPQYEGLEKLYERYQKDGFRVLDFPCNQFLAQAPGSAQQINEFCSLHYQTTFDRFAKIKVNGRDADPLYVWLKQQKPGRISWNFTKFLVGRDGQVLSRYAPNVRPEQMINDVEAALYG